MTFEDFMTIITDTAKTDRQKAADIEALFLKASRPSPMAVQPMKARKPRQARSKPVSPASEAVNGFAGHDEIGKSDAH